jgi:hypothetical protein
MALRKPLVMNAGQIQQIQVGDTLDAPQGGGDVISQTNDEVGAVVIGCPVYNDANDGVKKAQANAAATAACIGLMATTSTAAAGSGSVMTNGVLTATTTQWDAVAGTTGGLTKGTRYYLSAATAGIITSTAPTTVGQYVVELGIGISTTEMLLNVRQAILL